MTIDECMVLVVVLMSAMVMVSVCWRWFVFVAGCVVVFVSLCCGCHGCLLPDL